MERILSARGVSLKCGSRSNRYVLKLDDIEIDKKAKEKIENPDERKRLRLQNLIRGKKVVVMVE